jgi:hypothetical protein
MSRLLFAAARGARIEFRLSEKSHWAEVLYAPKKYSSDFYRIHPDDAHLQYGPISTALRDAAKSGYMGTVFIAPKDMGSYSLRTEWGMALFKTDAVTRSLFLLILAEVLADEGL